MSDRKKFGQQRTSPVTVQLHRNGNHLNYQASSLPASNGHLMNGVARPNSVDIDSFYEDDTNDLMTKFTLDVKRLNSKNSHRSRGRYGRGLAKKNGAGGHFTWGVAGSEFTDGQLKAGIDPLLDNSDPLDPNYDSDSEENCKFETITPPLEDDDVEKFLTPVLMEYFEHADTNEVISSLAEVNIAGNYYRIPVVLISLALERKSSHRELASILLSDLYGKILSESDIQLGFDVLLAQLDDLELDTPDASTVLANFVARAIADDCLPPKYVTNAKAKLESKMLTNTNGTSSNGAGSPIEASHQNGHERKSSSSSNDEQTFKQQAYKLSPSELRAYEALSSAHSLINAKRGLIRLDTVWGLTGGARPVKYLVKQMRLLLKEYLSSLDSKEAERCLRELEVPHFYHEFVYEAILMGIEDTKKSDELTAIANLLKALSDINLISVDQMKKGFMRLFNEIPDIHIDVPHAYSTLEKFMQSCFEAKLFLPRDVINSVPSRGRKRFISEGDGGRFKD